MISKQKNDLFHFVFGIFLLEIQSNLLLNVKCEKQRKSKYLVVEIIKPRKE